MIDVCRLLTYLPSMHYILTVTAENAEQAAQNLAELASALPVQSQVFVLATPIVLALIKFYLPRLDKKYLPLIALFGPMLLDMMAHFSLGTSSSWLISGLAGLTGVGLREAVSKAQKLVKGNADETDVTLTPKSL